MPEDTLLAALQHGDSFFPSGSVSFSWGLEPLCTDGKVETPNDVARFLEGQLQHRWAPMDRVFAATAHRNSKNMEAVLCADRKMEAMTLPRELRQGSRASGKALLHVHEKMGTFPAGLYRKRIHEGDGFGHLAVVQGLLLANAGLDLQATLGITAHTTCVGILGAAVRLGRMGSMESQCILSTLRPVILNLIRTPIPDLDHAGAYALQTEIAAMRHETQDVRLFSN
ncbi:MAG: urease accessory protein UreF [Deltaproteobacteria bacterium]|nr:urease accessory protein UreF [Deltaproteobacteria bacterium]